MNMTALYHQVREVVGQRDFSDEIMHYTSLDSFFKILESRQLFFSSIDDLNDTSEYEHFIGELKERKFRYFRDRFPNFLTGQVLDVSSAKKNTFVSSWCEYTETNRQGSLGMWREYAREDGIAIVVDASQVKGSRLVEQNLGFPINSSHIDYVTGSDIIEYVEDYLERFSRLPFAFPQDFMEYLYNLLAVAKAPCIKHPAYADEREIRFVHMPYLMGSDDPQVGQKRDVKIGGISKRKYIMNLNRFDKFRFNFSIENILSKLIISPYCANPDAAESAISQRLEGIGLKNVEILRSTIPVRLSA